MAKKNEFRLTNEHLQLLRATSIGWDDCEYGAPAIDPKRPYGNSFVELDIVKIMGWLPGDTRDFDWDSEEGRELQRRARVLHLELQDALQILVIHAGGAVKPGLYRQQKEYDIHSWEWVEE